MKPDINQIFAKTGEIGFVQSAVSSLVYAEGLPGAKPQEVVLFESGKLGEVLAIKGEVLELLSFAKEPVRVGSRVARTGEVLQISVGEDLLGSVIDPLGHPLYLGKQLLSSRERRPIDVVPAGISSRSKIKRRCATGVTLVDRLLPLGKGQRELVIGEQKTGKTRFLLRTLLSQVKEGSVGIYASIGKSQADAKQIEESLQAMGIADQTVLVVSAADDAPGLIYLTPYAAMTVAEYFRDQGRDVLLVLDDLSVHARTYREFSLLGKRFPGRNAYPGDIFYAHARLIERAGNFITASGEAAITCLPVVEAPQGDFTGFIQTNVMAMTDGHLFFDHTLFAEGRRPAIDPFFSVTRVGRQTQSSLEREMAQELSKFLKSTEKLRTFSSFGAELGEHIRSILAKEERLWQFFDQTLYDHMPLNVQILIFAMVWSDLWKESSRNEINLAVKKVLSAYESRESFKKRVDDFISACVFLKDLLERIKDFDLSRLLT